ncbi:hypothetical protein SAY87_000896 [Trapa incisa]|uniref:SAM domain-containing protein n=1 Tax=Trapa incisa TaxID=236973 RepID=A0AAN7GCD3_9MYRT|nr:hypothetical protein SAY87_000896 [Trapa incisa]
MYADRVESDAKRPLKERLNGSSSFHAPSSRRTVTGKRQREDDKWEHDLFQDDEPQFSSHKIGARDLRLKLRKKGLQPASQSGKPTSAARDLREKLSGISSIPATKNGGSNARQTSSAPKPTTRSAPIEASEETKSVANLDHKKKNQQKDNMENFLESLGLDKYTITFQAEEVDMAALTHMTDDDLKAMGIPMGPRKKILLALESKGLAVLAGNTRK